MASRKKQSKNASEDSLVIYVHGIGDHLVSARGARGPEGPLTEVPVVAQLDPMLRALAERGARELLLSEGTRPTFRFADGDRQRVVLRARSLVASPLDQPDPRKLGAHAPGQAVRRRVVHDDRLDRKAPDGAVDRPQRLFEKVLDVVIDDDDR